MRRSPGYILPMTLVLLALSAAVLARVCRQGMRESLRAAEDTQQLQRKWGMLSCQSTLLPRAQEIVTRSTPLGTSVVSQLSFGGQHYQLLFADEQAKLNLNMLYRERGRQECERYVRSCSRAGSEVFSVRLRPFHRYGERMGQINGHLTPFFASFGQVVEDSGSFKSATQLMNASHEMTCWGNGKLNYRLASRAEITEITENDPKLLKQILEKKKAPPVLAQALEPMNLLKHDGRSLDTLFTDTSVCYSLWIVAHDANASEARFAVVETGDDGQTHVTSLSW